MYTPSPKRTKPMKRKKGESAASWYKRLKDERTELELLLRQAKREATRDLARLELAKKAKELGLLDDDNNEED